ncbi:hypothetical protein ABIF63_001747 [Bradyrhizobium japonicum]|uniref:Uncharacterized protein n=1 Tax=Bradyrhizobium japonicum TaxID=375 RepID=A0ABV2RL32_BRAJP|nr:hypothetical protein [Bradyrhizobium japonicum]WLB18732.1 hypothetical protein QIH95_43490 [Bradyrhizobium japonicum]
MTRPFCEPRILEMPLEKHAEIAVDGGLWLIGERLAQRCLTNYGFVPDPRYAYKPRHRETAIIALCQMGEELRHEIFVAGFMKLPNNGAQGTVRRLLVTHTEMLHEALRIAWDRRLGSMIDVSKPPAPAEIERLHKVISSR